MKTGLKYPPPRTPTEKKHPVCEKHRESAFEQFAPKYKKRRPPYRDAVKS